MLKPQRRATWLGAPLLGLCLLAGACGGGSGGGTTSPPVTLPPSGPTPTPTPTPPPTAADFRPVINAVEVSALDDFSLIIGDESGILFTYQKGAVAPQDNLFIASASKWLTAATILRLVDRGVMALDDNPQDYLDYWTDDPDDPRSQISLRQLLSFTSGFNVTPRQDSCVDDGDILLRDCARTIYDGGNDTLPGEGYAYGPEHMQIAAAMAESATGQAFAELYRSEIASPLGMTATTRYAFPSSRNPRASGGTLASGEDYALFLQALLSGNFLASQEDLLRDETTNVAFLFRPGGTIEDDRDWHYALGNWIECPETPFTDVCAEARIHSSPGGTGFLPWVDFRNGYFAIIARQDSNGLAAPASVDLEQQLQPLIVEALR